ncbi:hypothetical protein C4587_00600 [Candidatus Parcubacteria bacterium]|nr:MAG: hypothetical protein C4587_00600 [Candidatus Parcubacteria bacterium]
MRIAFIIFSVAAAATALFIFGKSARAPEAIKLPQDETPVTGRETKETADFPKEETRQPTTTREVPPGFKGPTGPPKIIGPKSDPPNY